MSKQYDEIRRDVVITGHGADGREASARIPLAFRHGKPILKQRKPGVQLDTAPKLGRPTLGVVKHDKD